MTSLPPPYDFAKFEWKSDPSQQTFTRLAGGGEILQEVWGKLNDAEQKFFTVLTVHSPTIDLSDNKKRDHLIDAAKKAWLQLRFELPSITGVVTDTDPSTGAVIMTYRTLSNQAEAEKWADLSFKVIAEGGADDGDFIEELRTRLGQLPIPDENGLQSFLYFVVPPPSSQTQQNTFYLILRCHHTLTDGAGSKAFFTRYLTVLADKISGTDSGPKLEWGTEHKNLTPVIYHVLNEEEAVDGPGYLQTLGGVMTDVQKNVLNHGFLERGPAGPGISKRVKYDFTPSETTQLLSAVKALRPDFTITHIAHAALTMVVASDNPPSQSDVQADQKIYFTYGLVNGRDRLRSSQPHSIAYTGLCLALTPILIPISSFDPATDNNKEKEKATLLKVTEMINQEYKRQKSYPALLAVGAQEVDLILSSIQQAAVEAAKAGVPFEIPPWTGPWFGGDGIGERYLEPTYTSPQTGETIFEVEDVFIGVNRHQTGPFYRIASWGGKLKLMVDYNSTSMPTEIVEKHFQNWVDNIRLILS